MTHKKTIQKIKTRVPIHPLSIRIGAKTTVRKNKASYYSIHNKNDALYKN